MRNGWATRIEQPVKNRDLWEVLLGVAEQLEENGLLIKMW